jgi:hypothetical protein
MQIVCVLYTFNSIQYSTLSGINQCVGLYNERHFVLFMSVHLLCFDFPPPKPVFQGLCRCSYLLLHGTWLATPVRGSWVRL